MKVVSIPSKLRLASALALICIPVAGFETWIVLRSPGGVIPLRAIGLSAAVASAIVLPFVAVYLLGKQWSLHLGGVLSALWVLATVWLAIQQGNPSVGFFAVFLALSLAGLLVWLRRERGRSFFNPGLKWYQGLPQPIPGVSCRYESGTRFLDLRVSRLDAEGVFLFSESAVFNTPDIGKLRRGDLVFKFRERQVRCSGSTVSLLESGHGAGFQFVALAPDTRKELGDFIEILRGEGYVS